MSEIKCPDCGSSEIEQSIYEIKKIEYVPLYSCVICRDKARLDKVLSKMKSYKKISNHKFYSVGDSKISIEFNNGKFYLEDRDERQVQISLDTVESLINDLEGK